MPAQNRNLPARATRNWAVRRHFDRKRPTRGLAPPSVKGMGRGDTGNYPYEGPYLFQIGRYELLERACSVRVTVPSPNLRRLAICRIDSPWRRSSAT